MRVASGKGNDAKKILTFYRVNFGIRAPYRVLCDGALIHQSLQRQLYLRESLNALLGDSGQAVVTRCVIDELRALGERASSAALFAKRLTRVPCAHDGPAPAADCLAAAVSSANPRRLLLATCDVALRRSAEKQPGVPLVRLLDGARFVLAPPSKATLEAVAEAERLKADVRRPDEQKLLNEEREARQALRKERQAVFAKKRKRSEPNPLSVKKPKSEKRKAVSTQKRDSASDGGESAAGTHDQDPSSSGPDDATQVMDDCAKTQDAEKKPKRVRKRKPKSSQADRAASAVCSPPATALVSEKKSSPIAAKQSEMPV